MATFTPAASVSTTFKPTFFKLKSARSYRLHHTSAARVLDVKVGEVLEARTKDQDAWFRSKNDVLVECDKDGTPLSEKAQEGRGKASQASYTKYKPAKPASTVRVGSPT